MSLENKVFINAIVPTLPLEIVEHLVREYQSIKQNLVLAKYSPSELNGGRFAECIIRLIQHLDNPPYTPFGKQIQNVDQIIRRVENNTNLHESVRFYIPRLSRIMLDIRNRRNVAHVGGEVDPNYSDSLFVSQTADWILIELIRVYYNCLIDEARRIVDSINQVHVPIIFNFNGFLKVQNSTLEVSKKVLLLLYYRKPENATDSELLKWTKYANSSRFKNVILQELDDDALIHYDNSIVVLTTKGIAYVEKYLSMEISV